ncbi:MAG: hypothetical protein JWM40_1605 [Frankiales bacterium]|nr:hypothetical protein [Frankiales bacterium]
MDVSARLTRWLQQHFDAGDVVEVLSVLRDLPPGVVGGQDLERVQAALVLNTTGDVAAFQRQLALAAVDWRDSLVAGGLANAGWSRKLDAVLGIDDDQLPRMV